MNKKTEKSKIYWTGVEYSYGKKSDNYKELKGGFVYAFINAIDVREALGKLLKELKKQDLNPLEVEFISPYDEEMEWETNEQTNHYLGLYEEALKSEEVVFDDFYAYEVE